MVTESAFNETFSIGVLDDSIQSLRLCSIVLKSKLGCEVFAYSHGKDLISGAVEHPCDLYLIDVIMPEVSGIEIGQRLKKMPETQDVPIIYFSGHGKPETRVEALRSGGIDFMEKPFFPEELVSRVRNHLELSRSHRTISKQIMEQQALLRLICNDLLNPISATKTLLELREGPEDSLPSEVIDLISEATESALTLIGNISEFRRVIHDEEALSQQMVHVPETLYECFGFYESYAQSKSVEVKINVKDDCTLKINRVSLNTHILGSLIHNAIKFSPPGSEVELNTYVKADRCYIEVIDRGIGIPRLMLVKLDNPAAKIIRKGTAGENGTGYSTPLVFRYVRKFGGSVEVESSCEAESPEQPSGTCVRLSFALPSEGASMVTASN